MGKKIDALAANTIRFLCADQVQKANSGHPGAPMALAPAAWTLWSKILKHNPKNPNWINRDRFVLSSGHASTLLYSLLHLFGYGLSIDDLKSFRQLGSKTPGHPEYGHTAGVETTTGPLGQGIANAVGFALAEKHLAARFNNDDYKVIDHHTFVICGDGCLMEGISSEACSLAGSLNLNKLIILYDSNNITIEGDTDIAFREKVLERYKAYGFKTYYIEDGNDMPELQKIIERAKKSDRPVIIEIKTKIGYGAPNKQGTAAAHGEPLGFEEIKLAKTALGFEFSEHFAVPDDVSNEIAKRVIDLEQGEKDWNQLLADYKADNPELAVQWDEYFSGKVDEKALDADAFWEHKGDLATRISSETVLNRAAAIVPNLIGGSADLAPSTKAVMKGKDDFSDDTPYGKNLHFGVREHAMTAVANGIALHGGLIPYTAGFFVFSDYAKGAIRLAALMGVRSIYVFTHDSIGVGEDGPTHQPVEHLAALRAVPNLTVFRPADSRETSAAWSCALRSAKTPTAIVLSRQKTKLLKETGKGALKGGYILRDTENPNIILMASGSEVELIYKAFDILVEKGLKPRVVSMPSMELFDAQPARYRESVLPKEIERRIAVEAASPMSWYKYTGLCGIVIGIETFGASAPADELFQKFGFTADKIVEKALTMKKC